MKTMINIKADKEVKETAQKLASEIGLPLSGIINAFLKEFIRERSISFSAIPKMAPKLERLLDEVEGDIRLGKNMSPIFHDIKKAEAYLSSL